MSILLAFMFMVHMLGAIFLLPVLACWLNVQPSKVKSANKAEGQSTKATPQAKPAQAAVSASVQSHGRAVATSDSCPRHWHTQKRRRHPPFLFLQTRIIESHNGLQLPSLNLAIALPQVDLPTPLRYQNL